MTDKINDGGAAFPVVNESTYLQEGMSKRDWFAGMALSELVKVAYYHPSVKREEEEPTEAGRIARHAYIYADAMIKEGE